jgi:hypothetical protein
MNALVTTLPTVKQINQKSLRLGAASGMLQQHIHEHALVIAQHIAAHGDVTIADTLVNALGKSIRKNPLRDWFLMYGGCQWNADKKAFRKAKDFTFELEVATANPFWELAPEPEYKPMDILKEIEKLVAKAKKHLAETDSEKLAADKINTAVLAQLEALVPAK